MTRKKEKIKLYLSIVLELSVCSFWNLNTEINLSNVITMGLGLKIYDLIKVSVMFCFVCLILYICL